MKLVKVEKGRIMTDSLVFAEEFGLMHLHVLEKIRKLITETSIVRNQFMTIRRNKKYIILIILN